MKMLQCVIPKRREPLIERQCVIPQTTGNQQSCLSFCSLKTQMRIFVHAKAVEQKRSQDLTRQEMKL